MTPLFESSLFRSLLEVSRMYQSSMMELLKEQRGHTHLKLAFQEVIVSIPKQGIRPTALANKLGMQKQNSGALTKSIEQAGYISRINDENDKRAQLLVINQQGQKLVKDGIEVTTELDQAIETLLGAKRFLLIKTSLLEIALSQRLNIDISVAEQPGIFISTLIAVANFSSRELLKIIRSDGHEGIRGSHGQVIMYIAGEGMRINTIAKANDVSKQAVARIVSDIEALGYINTVSDPNDKRGKIILLADKGKALIESSEKAAKTLLEYYMEILGEKNLNAFVSVMRQLYEGFPTLLMANNNVINDHGVNEKGLAISNNQDEQQKLQTVLGLLHSIEAGNPTYSRFLQFVGNDEKRQIKLTSEALNQLKDFTLTEQECEQAMAQLLELISANP